MKLRTCLLTVLVPSTICAGAIYHDPTQEVPLFSDRPNQSSTPFTTTPSNQAPLHLPQIQPPRLEQKPEEHSVQVWFVTPQDQTTLDTSITTVPVQIGFSPDDQKDLKWVLALNGTQIAGPQKSTRFTLPALERGTHTLTVRLQGVPGVTTSLTLHQKRAHVPSTP